MILPIIPILLIGVGKYLFDLIYNPITLYPNLVEYTCTDSELWTLEDLQWENDPNCGRVITGIITEP